jgi:phosphopantothenoylcysteine decarboxylase / phosphopantothenate---cysteine ligase
MAPPTPPAPEAKGPLAGRGVVLGVSGSIAVVKAPQIVTLLTGLGARVQVATTAGAREFIGPPVFEALTRDPVLTEADQESDLDRLIPDPAAFLVAPASARTLVELATDGPGLLAAIGRRCSGPLVIAPAMESRMYVHPATQRHLRALRERGAQVIGPAEGRLASGAYGQGRLVEPADLVAALQRFLVSGQ